ncbi:SCO7613 C-terminal domain-containing membrane protein [Nonomuraea ferruginea]
MALALLGGFVIWLLARQGDVEGETWAAVVTAGTALTLIAVVAAPAQAALAGPGAGWRSLAYLVPALAVVLAATWLPWRRVRLAGMATGGLVALLVTLTLLPRLVVTLGSPLPWLDVFWTGTWGGPQWQPFATASPADVVVLGTVAAALLVAAVWGAGGRPVMEVLPGTAGRAVPRGESESESESEGKGEGEGEGKGKSESEGKGEGEGKGGGASGRCGWRRAGRWWSGRSWSPSRPRPSRCPTRPWWRSRWRWPSRWRSPPRWAGRRGGPGRARSSPGRPRRGRRRTRSAASRATLIVLPVLASAAAVMALAGRTKELQVWAPAFGALFLGLEAVAAGLSLGVRVLVAASMGFAVAGVLALLWSLRAGQGGARGLRYTGAVLLLLASWLRLGADEVTVVEAYTVPCSLVLLGSGWWRRRGAPAGSWAAYGAGLSFTMLPSLVAVYADAEWRRSLGLGVVALVVLVAGARFRLRAPTVIGAVVLAGVAVRELAPYVSEMLLVVPRWAPIAVGGLLLVVVGATYEARMRDLRKLRDTLTAMD